VVCFVSFGSSTTGHIAERKPDLEGFVSFGSSTTGHIHGLSACCQSIGVLNACFVCCLKTNLKIAGIARIAVANAAT
jgi:hypothetical protein